MKELCLGSAMWGWSVSEQNIFSILDCFYARGFRFVDVAWNYPINGRESDLSLAPRLLSKWIEKREVEDLKVIFKAGAKDNSGENGNDLGRENLYSQFEQALNWFGSNLFSFMIHWDNRKDTLQIEETVKFLGCLKEYGILPGLSGVADVDLYSGLLEGVESDLLIQCKHSFIESHISRYEAFLHNGARIFAYGVSGSGLKLSSSEYREDSYVSLVREPGFHDRMLSDSKRRALERVLGSNSGLRNLYHVGIAYAMQEPRLSGLIISPTNVDQLTDSLDFFEVCKTTSFDLEGI